MKKILIIRRDNIGDLICTTPLIRTLRQNYPETQLDCFVNSYNKQAIQNNTDLNHIFTYTKAKHRTSSESIFKVYWDRVKLIYKLRCAKYDLLIIAGSFSKHSFKLANQIRAKRSICFASNSQTISGIDHPILEKNNSGHEVERTHDLLAPLGIDTAPPKLHLNTSPKITQTIKNKLIAQSWTEAKQTIGIHISARKPSQRWSVQNFIKLIKALNNKDVQVLLFWAPGDEQDARHPGDNQKAQTIMEQCSHVSIFPCETKQLSELIAGVDICDFFICSDGGAMHIAAGLNKPIVCMFGDSDAQRWYPWGTSHELLQPKTKHVEDISVNDVLTAFERLQESSN